MRKLIFKLIILSLMSGYTPNSVGFVVIDPTNLVQNVTSAVNSGKALLNQAEQLKHQVEMIKDQVKNLKSLKNYQWHDIDNLMKQLNNTAEQGRALSYQVAEIDKQFRRSYTDYASDKRTLPTVTEAHTIWSATTLDTLRHTISESNTLVEEYNHEKDYLNQLKLQANAAVGEKQILQVLSEITAENIHQLQELKRLMVAQVHGQTAYMGYQVSEDSYVESSVEKIAANFNTDYPDYQDNSDFSLIPYIG